MQRTNQENALSVDEQPKTLLEEPVSSITKAGDSIQDLSFSTVSGLGLSAFSVPGQRFSGYTLQVRTRTWKAPGPASRPKVRGLLPDFKRGRWPRGLTDPLRDPFRA